MSFFRVNDKCNGCLACVQNCPASALDYVDQGNKRSLLHNMARCARCGNCWRVCPTQAIEFQHLLDGKWEEVTALNLVRCIISQAHPGTPSSKWLSSPTLVNSVIVSSFTVILLPFNCASHPSTAVNIESVAGSKITPTMGRPSYITAILTAKKSIRLAKLLVPSIGSITHQICSAWRGFCLKTSPWSPSSAIKP